MGSAIAEPNPQAACLPFEEEAPGFVVVAPLLEGGADVVGRPLPDHRHDRGGGRALRDHPQACMAIGRVDVWDSLPPPWGGRKEEGVPSLRRVPGRAPLTTHPLSHTYKKMIGVDRPPFFLLELGHLAMQA